MSSLPPLHGHDDVRAALARAIRDDSVPGSILLHGPPGVGKQRTGLWLAQCLLCTGPADSMPCGRCRPCRLLVRLEHPDVHWFFPLPRPRSYGSLDRRIQAIEDARADALAARRDAPLRPTSTGEPVGLYLAQVHAIRRIAASRPAMGDRQIFLVGQAERLVPQESSPEAANAFLKILEEPPEGTSFILTSDDPDALLPTLRSRLQPIRLRRLPEPSVVRFLVDERGADREPSELAARLSQGSIGRALAFLPDGETDGPLEALRQNARDLLKAAASPRRGLRLAAAHARRPTAARGDFHDMLGLLALWLRDLGAIASGADSEVVNVDATAFLADLARNLPGAMSGIPRAIQHVEEARDLSQGNVNPQLTLAWLLRSLNGVLTTTA